MIANQCDATNCTCQSFPSNNTDLDSIIIEDFGELFKSNISLTATSNLTFQNQPVTCTTAPFFTLSMEIGGQVFKTISANVEVDENINTSLANLLGINLSDEIDFVTGNYVFRLTAHNLEVEATFDNYAITTNEVIHNGPGLRVKKISKITNDASLSSSISYTYDAIDETTSGFLFNTPKTNSYFQSFYNGVDNTINLLGINKMIDLSGEREELTLYSDGYEPLTNFEKGFGFYTRVTEHYLNGATKVSEFERVGDTNPIRVTSGLPVYLPYNSSLLNKKVKQTASLDKDGNAIQLDTFNNEVNEAALIPGTRFQRWIIPVAYHNGSGFTNDLIFIKYPLVTSNVRLRSQSITLDGVPISTEYAYRSDNAHLLPIEQNTFHTDNSIETVTTKYAHDVSNTDLISHNLVHIPVETNRYIDDTQTTGQQTKFSLFGGFPRPDTLQSYNWQTQLWETEMAILSYDARGNPLSRQARGWNTESFTWDYDLIKTRTFENFTWEYEYHPNSRLLQKHTEPNGLFTTFDYNGFLQLSQINQYEDKVITTQTYDHRLTEGSNKITTTINHLEGADFITEQEFDGLGRKVLDRKVGYGHNNQDLLFSIEYDSIGRLWKEYEPAFQNASSAYTRYTYEESPLNRVDSIIPPAPLLPTKTTYGNENNTLFTQTITNALGQTNQTFTDTRGRMLRQVNGRSPELATTRYRYDDRNNVLRIIPHGRSENDLDYIYSYLYDGRNNPLISKIPEKSTLQMRYDLRDLVTHSKDGIHPVIHTQYDNFGRIRQTGFVASLSATTFTDTLTDNTYITHPDSLGFGQLDQTKIALLDSAAAPTGQYIISDISQWDIYHRPLTTAGNHPLNLGISDALKIETTYNSLDQIKTNQTTVQIGNRDWTTLMESTYDHSARMSEEYCTVDGERRQTCQTPEYNQWDAVVIKIIANDLQTIDYSYYENGFLKGINANFINGGIMPTSQDIPTINTNNDLFSMALTYDAIGNITTWQSQNRGFASETNTYTYDGLNRILSSNSSFNNYHQAFTYKDLIGNINTINRYDLVLNNGSWEKQQIDSLTFSYQGTKSSRLQSVADDSNHEKGYRPNDGNYNYDNNGNRIYDPQRQLSTKYNFMNLCALMTKSTGAKLEYIYDATGNKWQQIEYDALGNAQKRSYIGGMEFLGNTLELVHHTTGFVRNLNAGATATLVLSGDASGNQTAKQITSTETVNTLNALAYKADESITLQAGFEAKAGSDLHLTIEPISTEPDYEWQYRIADHLGNTRVLFADKDNDGLIRQAADSTNEVLAFYNYSAFGLELGGSQLNANNNLNRYTYNGKEDIGFSGYQDFGWRMFDRSLARFTGVDPIADQFANLSTYNYASNDPVKNVDLHGLQGVSLHELWNKTKAALGFDSQTLGQGVRSQQHANSISQARSYVPVLQEKLQNVVDAQAAVVPGLSTAHKMDEGDLLGAATDAALDAAGGKILSSLFGGIVKRFNPADDIIEFQHGLAALDGDGFLDMVFDVPSRLKGQGIGTEMFDKSVDLFGDKIKGINGTWLGTGDLKDNYDAFIKKYKELGDDAVWETFTGRQAKKHGFTNANVNPDLDSKRVDVVFTRD